MMATAIPGYTYGTDQVAHAPLTMQDLDLLKQAVLFGPEDEQYLRMAGEVLADQIDDVLDLWYGFVGSHPHLVYYFTDGHGNPKCRLSGSCAQALRTVDSRYLHPPV
jgi:hypothetical protein